MTFFHSVAWERGMALRVPSPGPWPRDTTLTATDVLVGGRSLDQIARAEGTPCLRIAEAPDTGLFPPGRQHLITALVTSVEAISMNSRGRPEEIWVDAELDGCRPRISEARLIGRPASGRRRRVALRPTTRTALDGHLVRLPADVQLGDLIAIPCEGPCALHDVRRRSYHPERLDDGRWADDGDEFTALGRCGK